MPSLVTAAQSRKRLFHALQARCIFFRLDNVLKCRSEVDGSSVSLSALFFDIIRPYYMVLYNCRLPIKKGNLKLRARHSPFKYKSIFYIYIYIGGGRRRVLHSTQVVHCFQFASNHTVKHGDAQRAVTESHSCAVCFCLFEFDCQTRRMSQLPSISDALTQRRNETRETFKSF